MMEFPPLGINVAFLASQDRRSKKVKVKLDRARAAELVGAGVGSSLPRDGRIVNDLPRATLTWKQPRPVRANGHVRRPEIPSGQRATSALVALAVVLRHLRAHGDLGALNAMLRDRLAARLVASMTSGFDRAAVALLDERPSWGPDEYAAHKGRLHECITAPGRALIAQLAARLDAHLTVEPRKSVSPLHRDLRFAPAGSARYKDHLLLTTWEGADKRTLRLTGFQVRFTDELPETISAPRFADWCAERLEELLPVHRWLGAHISTPNAKG